MTAKLPSLEALADAVRDWPRLPVLADDKGGLLGVAVSGGADSVYLLLALWADPLWRPRLRVYHFDHRVRGVDSSADADFVRGLCASLGLACRCGQREGEGVASEQELRVARNAFLAAEMAAENVRLLATAHHVDDLVETVLLRLARGAGLGGLSAPRVLQPFRDGHRRWRPLIAAGLGKDDLLRALGAAGLPWREDATNALPVAGRNRIRLWLAQGSAALGPRYRAGFVRSARILDDANVALLAWGRELGCVCDASGRMDITALKGRPEALVHAVLADFLHGQGFMEPGVNALAPVLSALRRGDDCAVSVRGRQVRVRAGRLGVLPGPLAALGPALRSLPVGSEAEEVGLACERVDVDAELWAKLARGDISPAAEVYLCPGVAHELQWRGRLEGDRYRPLGAPGEAKVSDLLINRKVPSELRDALPVVLGGGEILWLPGLPPAENARLSGPTRGALRLTWLGPCLGSIPPA